MKPSFVTVLVSLSAPLVRAVAVPEAADAAPALVPRFSPAYGYEGAKRDQSAVDAHVERLFKRKGGGGSGGRGGSSSGSSSGKGSSSSSSSSSSSKGGSSSSYGSPPLSLSSPPADRFHKNPSRAFSFVSVPVIVKIGHITHSGSSSSSSGKGLGSSSSNTGGRTTTGSGTKASYGGGTYYSGGGSVPYRSGATSPSGISPVYLGAAAGVTAYAFWPGVWYHPIYYYPYGTPYSYYNHSSRRNETKNIGCGCDETVECSCDYNSNSTFMNEIIGNGSYDSLNKTVVNVADVNGTSTILLNGTLANGTTAAGGTESASMAVSAHVLAWWPLAATFLAVMYAL